MTAIIIDGKAIAAKVRQEAALGVAEFRHRHGRAPGLHVVLAGEDPGSVVYVRNKEKDAVEAGFAGVVHRLPASVTEDSLLGLVRELNQDDGVDGILVQLPLPRGLNSQLILGEINAKKDVDGFHPLNVGALWSGMPGLVPCTPRGCIRLLDEYQLEIAGKRALVVGRSNIVGKPMAALLLGRHATVSIAHSKTADLPARCREADILVAAIGQRRMVQGDWIKPGAVVIDVGMNQDEDGKLCGDVDTRAAMQVASAITPVPGGVGPMTRAMLLDNTLHAARGRL
jgi:methylenetetrahydrofolate dehydrogenase (NADP+) / methenyltetrahydrofolate cyclohydrolase